MVAVELFAGVGGFSHNALMANQYTGNRPDKDELLGYYHHKNMTQMEIGVVYGVGQQAVQKWFKRLGIPARVAKKRNQNGELNDSWKGDERGIAALHKRVKKLKGSPNLCSHCGTTDPAKAYEWANISGQYLDENDFLRLCRSCHKKYDNIISNIRKEATP